MILFVLELGLHPPRSPPTHQPLAIRFGYKHAQYFVCFENASCSQLEVETTLSHAQESIPSGFAPSAITISANCCLFAVAPNWSSKYASERSVVAKEIMEGHGTQCG